MKLLLDEDVPVPLTELLRHILREHDVLHVYDVGWGTKIDRNLYRDARRRGFDAVLTNNLRQLNDPDECRAIQQSGLHHITYELPNGLDGLALACGAICAAIRPVVVALSAAPSQRLVRITGLAATRKRYAITNPATHPPAYWP